MEHGLGGDPFDTALDFVAGNIGSGANGGMSAMDKDVMSWMIMNGDLFGSSDGVLDLSIGAPGPMSLRSPNLEALHAPDFNHLPGLDNVMSLSARQESFSPALQMGGLMAPASPLHPTMRPMSMLAPQQYLAPPMSAAYGQSPSLQPLGPGHIQLPSGQPAGGPTSQSALQLSSSAASNEGILSTAWSAAASGFSKLAATLGMGSVPQVAPSSSSAAAGSGGTLMNAASSSAYAAPRHLQHSSSANDFAAFAPQVGGGAGAGNSNISSSHYRMADGPPSESSSSSSLSGIGPMPGDPLLASRRSTRNKRNGDGDIMSLQEPVSLSSGVELAGVFGNGAGVGQLHSASSAATPAAAAATAQGGAPQRGSAAGGGRKGAAGVVGGKANAASVPYSFSGTSAALPSASATASTAAPSSSAAAQQPSPTATSASSSSSSSSASLAGSSSSSAAGNQYSGSGIGVGKPGSHHRTDLSMLLKNYGDPTKQPRANSSNSGSGGNDAKRQKTAAGAASTSASSSSASGQSAPSPPQPPPASQLLSTPSIPVPHTLQSLAQVDRSVAEFLQHSDALYTENAALREQLRRLNAELPSAPSGSTAAVSAAAAREDERVQQLGKIVQMIHERVPEAQLKRAILAYKDIWADFGKERSSALRYHLKSLKQLLLPNQITRMCMWSVGGEDGHNNNNNNNNNNSNNNNHGHVASGSASQAQQLQQTHVPHSQQHSGAGAASSSAAAAPSATQPASAPASSGAAPVAAGPAASIWQQICSYCGINEEQQVRIMGLRDSIRSRRREFSEMLMNLKQLEDRVGSNFAGLEFQMNLLMSHLSPKQLALFLDWMERNHIIFNIISSLQAWPQAQPPVQGTGMGHFDAGGHAAAAAAAAGRGLQAHAHHNNQSSSSAPGAARQSQPPQRDPVAHATAVRAAQLATIHTSQSPVAAASAPALAAPVVAAPGRGGKGGARGGGKAAAKHAVTGVAASDAAAGAAQPTASASAAPAPHVAVGEVQDAAPQ